MSEFVRENGGIICILGMLVITVSYFYYRHRGALARRKPIKKRSVLMEDDWFAQLYPLSSVEAKAIAREVLEAIAKEIGVDWRQLRPQNTFEKTLCIARKYFPYDDLEEAEWRIVELATERGIKEIPPPGFTGPLSGFLDEWLELNGFSAPDSVRPIAEDQ